ncbi:MAG TPA: GntR family transcriptional regulator [Casimicrobiaceae bacterium]|nr:GntR family transcriptional regulator [Casimicrobiaceae bacterium]
MTPRSRRQESAETRICNAIRAAILERKLLPGTKLQEVPLGEYFGVSRTIVRQALRRLDHEGIVSLRTKRVAVVARPSLAHVRQVFAARRVIEKAVVSVVAEAITATELAALKRLVREENAAYAQDDRKRGLTLSLAFHHRLASLSGNALLERYLRELVLQSSLAIALYERSGVAHERADHDALVLALARRDGRLAARVMERHLSELERRLALDDRDRAPTLQSIFGAPA